MCAAGTYRHGRSSQDRGMTATRGVFRGDAEPDGTDMVSRQCPLWDDLLPAAPAERCRHGEHSSSYVRAKRRAPACQPDGALGAPAATLQAASYSFYCQRRDCKAAAAMRGAQRAQRGGGRRTFNTRIDRHGSTDLPAHHLKRHSWAFGAPQLSLLMLVLMSLGGPRETEGWIALSKDGYVVTRGLGLRNGTLVEGDMLVNGVLASSFNHTHVQEVLANAALEMQSTAALQELQDKLTGCTKERIGGLRWASAKDLEGCTEAGAWAPVSVCDRRCGFTQPPLPVIRTKNRAGAVDCTVQVCTPRCNRIPNLKDFPDLDVETCETLAEIARNLTAFENEPNCHGLSAANITDYKDFQIGGNDGATLLRAWGVADVSKYLTASTSKSTGVAASTLVCFATAAEDCETSDDRHTVCSKMVDYFPFEKNPDIQKVTSLYILTIDSIKMVTSTNIFGIAGLQGSLCTITYVNGKVTEIWTIGKTLNWAPYPANPYKQQLWRAPRPGDLGWQSAVLGEEFAKILPALQKVESVWDDPVAPIQGVVPLNNFTGQPDTKSCKDYNFSSPAFDYLRVYYNETGWEKLFPVPSKANRQLPDNISQCTGFQSVEVPWVLYNRLKYNWMKAGGAISSGFVKGKPIPYVPRLDNGTFVGNNCTFTLQAPLGFTTRLTVQYVELDVNDTFTIVSGDDFPDDEKFQQKHGPAFDYSNLIFQFVGPPGGGESNSSRGAVYNSPRFNYPVSIRLITGNESSAPGFLLFYDFIPRSELLREQADASQLQYAMSLLEMQGADLNAFQWDETQAQTVGDKPPGSAILGVMTDAESCFACCSMNEVLEQFVEEDILARENKLRDGMPLPPAWQIHPQAVSLGATSALARGFRSDVLLEDIPPLVSYMGYRPSHFIRTNFVSYLPPGSIKAPYGKPLGERRDFLSAGIADPSEDPKLKERVEVGWGMERVLLERGGNFTDRKNHGWGDGWGVGTGAGKGTHWRDDDGANDLWYPAWQLLVKSNYINSRDLPRFDYDLDHPGVPLFSFVDKNRRLVIANEMTLALPCGALINNTCGVPCQILGTGLNRLQCLTNQLKTRCNEPVVDACNNDCGMVGSKLCHESLTAVGAVRIRSLIQDDMTASFQMSVGGPKRLPEDNWTRSEDITGLGVDGVTLGSKGIKKTAWGHSSTSESSPDDADNALYFSFDDPAKELKDVEFDIFGVKEKLTLTREEFRVMVSQPIKLDIPIDCNVQDVGRDACKFGKSQNDVSKESAWFKDTEPLGHRSPSWDTDFDKRMSFSEMQAVIRQNVVFFSIADRGFRTCRSACDLVRQARDLSQRFFVGFGRRVDKDNGMTCTLDDIYNALCYLALDDIHRFLGEFEAFRRNFKETLFSQARFRLAKIQRMGSQGGFEIASPDPTKEHIYNHNTNTLRISTYFEATGEYIRLGSSRYSNVTKTRVDYQVPCLYNVTGKGNYEYGDGLFQLESGWAKEVVFYVATCPAFSEDLCYDGGTCDITFMEWSIKLDVKTISHVFIDGILNKEVPLVFRPSDDYQATNLKVETKREAVFGRPVLEMPKADPANPQSAKGERPLTLPDASGVIVTSGNLAAIRRMPGLRKRSSFTPNRYDSANVLKLDDAREILGGAYHYKKFQGNHALGCGRFKDGQPIPCDPLKTVYDALEDESSRSDDIFKYTGPNILQGSSLISRIPAAAVGARLDCSSQRQICGQDAKIASNQILRFIPKKINVCFKAKGDGKPCRCDKLDGKIGSECNGCKIMNYGICNEFPVWGGPGTGWDDFDSFEALYEKTATFTRDKEDWVFPFDSKTPPYDTCGYNISQSSNYTFLHIYYGTELGVRAWRTMGEYLNETRGYAPGTPPRAFQDTMPVQYAALKYLFMQGVAQVEWYEAGPHRGNVVENIGRLDLEAIWDSERSPDYTLPELPLILDSMLHGYTVDKSTGLLDVMEPVGFGVTDTEKCVACCSLYKEVSSPTNLEVETPCPYVNVSGFDEAEAIGGLYVLMEDRSFGSRAWKQTPGEYFLHMLPLACTSRPQCGTSIKDIPHFSGPAWVIGTELGSDAITAYAQLDFDMNVTDLHALRWQATRNPTSPHLKWQEHNRQENPISHANSTSPWVFWNDIEGRSREVGKGLRVDCLPRPVWQFATNAITFEDGTEYSKISVPDADGTLISTGNLEHITSIGTQVSPILGRHTPVSSHDGNSATTRIHFGIGWQTVNISGHNNNVDFEFTTRNLSYCQFPESVCTYAQKDSSFSCSKEVAFKTLPASSLEHCDIKAGYPVPGSDYSVDALLMTYAEKSDCVALFEIDENFNGKGDFMKLTTTQCAPGNTFILVRDDPKLSDKEDCIFAGINLQFNSWDSTPDAPSHPHDGCKTVEGTPAIPGILNSLDATKLNEWLCPTYNPNVKTLDQECKEKLRSACTQACLRDRRCVAAKPFLFERPPFAPDVRCQLIMDSCEQIPVQSEPPFETWVKKSGGWHPSKLSLSKRLNLSEGTKLALGEVPYQNWVVQGIMDEQIQLTWNLTSSKHYKICAEGFVSSGFISDPLTESSRAVSYCQVTGGLDEFTPETSCRCPAWTMWPQVNIRQGEAHVVTSVQGKSCCDVCGEFTGLPVAEAWRADDKYLKCQQGTWDPKFALADLSAKVGTVAVDYKKIDRLLCKCSSSPDFIAKRFCEPSADSMFSSPSSTHYKGVLVDPINLTTWKKGPLLVTIKNASSLVGSKRVRIGDDVFKVNGVNAEISQMSIEASVIRGLTQFYLPGTVVTQVTGGGFLNVTFQRDSVQIPRGIYSLENITNALNTLLASKFHDRQFVVSFDIVEPDAGLCGETMHGATRKIRSFHCAPASRYIQFSGGIKPNVMPFVSDDDAVHIFSTSGVLETLGIHLPVRAYSFGRASTRGVPAHAVHHSVLPGAGYVSSGYGAMSGYGLGGQPGWTNYVPPELILKDRVLHLTWCHDQWGPGFQCQSSGCECGVPVSTYAKVLGTTKTQRGEETTDNVIHVPSSADGIVLSTGNLEDIHAESSHITGLRINALLEHEKTLAMKINGRLEFASCNTVFSGAKDCSLIDTYPSKISTDRSDISIQLDSESSIAFHLWEKQVIWISLVNASENLYHAAVYGDSSLVWRLLPEELNAANKSFSSLQDEISNAKLGPVCNTYCKGLNAFEEGEAAHAIGEAASLLSEISSKVELTLHDQVELCEAVACYENAMSKTLRVPVVGTKNFTVVEYGNRPYDVCAASCQGSGRACLCSLLVTANSVCNPPHSKRDYDPRCDPAIAGCLNASEAHLWQSTIQGNERAQILNQSVVGYQKCANYISLTYKGRPECKTFTGSCKKADPATLRFEPCCSVLYAMGYMDIAGEVIPAQLESKSIQDQDGAVNRLIAPLGAARDHALKQIEEAAGKCVCVEVEGASLKEKGGFMDVKRHICHEVPGISKEMLMQMGEDGKPYVIPSGVCTADGGSNIQLGFNGSESRTVFRFEKTAPHQDVPDYLMMPYTNGVVVTSGNLDAVTKEAGSMTSLHVKDVTEIVDMVFVGIVGQAAESHGSRLGTAGTARTTVDTITNVASDAKAHCQGTDVSGTNDFCVRPAQNMVLMNNSISLEGAGNKSNLSFAHAAGEWVIAFPTWDDELCAGGMSSSCVPRDPVTQRATLEGKIITTGNLQDLEELSPHYFDTSGHVEVEGPVKLGSGYSCQLPGLEISTILTKAHVPNYPYAAWSVFVASQCLHMQGSVDWEKALHLELAECKKECQRDPTCGGVVQKKEFDRSPQTADARCVLLQTLASDCTVKSHPGQDLHLLIREAPSPWFDFEADHHFFDSICQNFRSNLTHVPGTPIRLRNYLGGDIVYRESNPYEWTKYPNYTCDSFSGFKLAQISKEESPAGLTADYEHSFTGFLTSECKAACDRMQGCSILIVSTLNGTCAFAPNLEVRQTLANWDTLTGFCKRVPREDVDLHIFKEDQQTLLKFEAPTKSQEIKFPDASGVILTTGNLYDIGNGIGLIGKDIFKSNTEIRELGLVHYDIGSNGLPVPPQSSLISGREQNMIVRGCELLSGCLVYSSASIDDTTLAQHMDTHVPKKDGIMSIDNRFGPQGVRGTGSGFDFFETFVDVALPGTRTEGECVGECKGNFPCQRSKFTCHPGCDGYLWPRPGIAEDAPCSEDGVRGKPFCGCANGKPYGKFGTGVCHMPQRSHPDHGRYCRNMTSDGTEYNIFECCTDSNDKQNCGQCITYAPVVPTGLNQRLTFPIANGTIITTGNVDDLKLYKVRLEALFLVQYMNFGNQFPKEQNTTPTSGGPSGYRYKDEFDVWASHSEFDPVSSRVDGGFRLVAGYGHPNVSYTDLRAGKDPNILMSGSAVPDPYTFFDIEPPTLFPDNMPLEDLPQFQKRYCMESTPYHFEENKAYDQEDQRTDLKRCRYKREILMPDTSGKILTTGNLLDVPGIAIAREDLILATTESKLKVWGNVTWGRRVNYTHDPHNHYYNHELGEIAFLAQQFQSSAQMYARLNGEVGLTFQTAGEEIPLITFAPTVGSPDHPWKIDKYGNFSGPAPFGGAAPTEEIIRFSKDGRAGDNRTELWSGDRVKLNFPLGGGTDKALRDFIRDGAPALPITVQDHLAATSDANGLGDHFGYKSGRPVLHMRSMTYPSDQDSYNDPSESVSPALLGSNPINESWCYQSMQALALRDASFTANQDTTMSSLSRHLSSAGFIKQTQIRGDFSGSPPFTGDLTGNRVDLASCKAFAWDTVQKLEGTREYIFQGNPPVTIQMQVADQDGNYQLQNNVFESIQIKLYRNKSQITYGANPQCDLIKYNTTFKDVRVLNFGIGCKEHAGSVEMKNVESIEACFKKCLTFEDGVCSGFVLSKSNFHLDNNLAGTCQFVRSQDNAKCTLTAAVNDLKVGLLPGYNYTAYNVTVETEKEVLSTRDCRPEKDSDYTRPEFDSYRNQYGLSSGVGLSPDLEVTEKELCYVCCVLNTSTQDLVQKAFDNDLETFHSYHESTNAVAALDLGPDNAAVITSLRFYPRPSYEASMLGGRFQGSDVSEVEGYVDLHLIQDVPPAREYTTVKISNPRAFRWLRYVGPAGTFGDVAEIEFHRGYMVEELSNMQPGNVSWNVDAEELRKEEHVEMAMLVKCAAYGFLPAFLTSSLQEILVPHSKGVVITTGNLEDINKETSSFSSINVAEDAIIQGSLILGDPEADSMLEVNAAVYGLSFRGPLIDSNSLLSIQQSPNSVEATFSLPDYSGTLVVGNLPSVMSTMNVLPSGALDFDWSVQFDGTVNFGGGSKGNSSLDILAVVGDSFPLSFGGTFLSDRKVSLGSPQASKNSILTLPDATGTILTTGSIPMVVGNISAIDRTILQGGVTFNDCDVEIGEQGLDVGLHLNANIMGFTSLTFDGTTRKDGRTLVLSAADPEGNNEITLPDTSGTVITTANFPTKFDSLRTLGDLEVNGNVVAEVDLIKIGGLDRLSHVVLKAHITGRFPLVFDGGSINYGQSSTKTSTTVHVPETSRHNIITFPDISGTVITSTTLPQRTVTTGTYTIAAEEFLVTSEQTLMGLSSKLTGHRGSFHFADTSAQDRGNGPERENQFMVHALGGVQFITGQTAKGKNTGAFLRPGSSAWYYLSDREAKSAFEHVNASRVVEGLGLTPVYRWRYSGNHSGHVHLGPMAQDMQKAFQLGEHDDRISSSDADGVSLAAVTGLYHEISRLNVAADSHRQHLAVQESTLMQQRAQLETQERVLLHLSARIQRLWKVLNSPLLSSHTAI